MGSLSSSAAQAGVDGKARGQRERGRLGQAGLREIVQQAGVVLVDGGERVLDVPERGVEDELHDAALLVAEERGERVVGVAVEAVEQANHLGEVGALHVLGGLGGEGFEGRGVGFRVGFDRGGDVLVAKVKNGKGEALRWPVMALAIARGPRQAAAARGVNVVGDAADVEAEEVGLIGKGGEDRADGVVGGDLLQVQLHGGDASSCRSRRRRRRRDRWTWPRPGARETPAPAARPVRRRACSRQLQHARGVGDDLHRLNAARYRRRTSRNWCT